MHDIIIKRFAKLKVEIFHNCHKFLCSTNFCEGFQFTNFMCTLLTDPYCAKLKFYRKPRYTHFCSVWNIILKRKKCTIWTSYHQAKNILKSFKTQLVKLKQDKALKFHVIDRDSLTSTTTTKMENYWEQANANGHAQPHPVKFERWEIYFFR